MSTPRIPLRLVLFAVIAIGGVLLVGFLVGLANSLLELYERMAALPLLLRVPLLVALALAVVATGVLAWRLMRPAARDDAKAPVGRPVAASRDAIEVRVADLQARDAAAASLRDELAELDRRRAEGDCHVALFGEISTGKSSLVRALAADAAPDVDALGGTTRAVHHYRGRLPDGRDLVLADMPGTAEVDGLQREQLARDEALRAHAVVYVVASDLTRQQDAELRWLGTFGKPVVLVLNKADQLGDAERAQLLARFDERYRDIVRERVIARPGGREHIERRLADGSVETVEREREADVGALREALQRLTRGGTEALEPAREAAVLARVAERSDAIAADIAAREAEATIARYTRRAVVGAMAAVAPGSDVLIQGALGTGLVRELARLHGVPVRELDVEALLARLGLTVRNTTAIVLAIAGNALKAFPGLGTLGGGVLHAIAYGLVFDSLGRAVAATLAEHARLDQADTEQRVRTLLAEPGQARLERVARLVLDSWRERDEAPRKD
ncbi:GTPase [Dokdonella sp. MW10]|uniref:GTPase n=1 Tax=Dokdonella sp. MW10 TaxID=2992926 RepID=UPI003F814C8E